MARSQGARRRGSSVTYALAGASASKRTTAVYVTASATHPSMAVLSPLIDAWLTVALDWMGDPEAGCWWLDPLARRQSIADAAHKVGWSSQASRGERTPWDLRVTDRSGFQSVLRIVSARCALQEAASNVTIEQASSVAQMGLAGARLAQHVHRVEVVFAVPFVPAGSTESEVSFLLKRWLAETPLASCGRATAYAYAFRRDGFCRNAAGAVFPGLGLRAAVVSRSA